jgi:hypothetical protein
MQGKQFKVRAKIAAKASTQRNARQRWKIKSNSIAEIVKSANIISKRDSN